MYCLPRTYLTYSKTNLCTNGKKTVKYQEKWIIKNGTYNEIDKFQILCTNVLRGSSTAFNKQIKKEDERSKNRF